MKENAQRNKLVLEDLSPYTKSRTFYYCANVQAILKPSKFCLKDLLTYMHDITSDMAQPCTYVHTGNLPLSLLEQVQHNPTAKGKDTQLWELTGVYVSW